MQKAAPGDTVDMWILSAFEKDRWLARKFGDLTHADHPGTAIKMGDDLYEILTAETTPEPGYTVRYGLKKWEAQHVVRQVIPYTPETQKQASDDYLEERHKQELRSRIAWLFPFAGLAPDAVQLKWETQTALNMTVISAASCLTGLALFMTVVQILGDLPRNPILSVAVEYIAFESFLRLIRIVFTGRPRGSFLLNVPYRFWERLAHPKKRVPILAGVRFAPEGDEVIRRPGTGHLVIRSMLFDDLLAGAEPVRFEGSVYQPLNWHEEGKGLSRRWVYEFQKTELDATPKYREYTQPRTPQRQKAVEQHTRSRDRVHILAGWWGTFPRREQLRLEEKYQFSSIRWTAITAGLFLIVGLLQIWAINLIHAREAALTFPAYLVIESLYRLYRAKFQDQPAGSILGLILGLVVHPPR